MLLFQLRNLFLQLRRKKILQPPLRSEHQPVEGAGIVAAFPTRLSLPLLLLQLLSKVGKYNKAPNVVLWVSSVWNNVYNLKGICFSQLFVFFVHSCSVWCYSDAGLVLHMWNSDCKRGLQAHKPKRCLDDIFIVTRFKRGSMSYQ